jgi:hypothetical protein
MFCFFTLIKKFLFCEIIRTHVYCGDVHEFFNYGVELFKNLIRKPNGISLSHCIIRRRKNGKGEKEEE